MDYDEKDFLVRHSKPTLFSVVADIALYLESEKDRLNFQDIKLKKKCSKILNLTGRIEDKTDINKKKNKKNW